MPIFREAGSFPEDNALGRVAQIGIKLSQIDQPHLVRRGLLSYRFCKASAGKEGMMHLPTGAPFGEEF